MNQPICHCCQNTDIIVGQQRAGGRPHSDPSRELASLSLPAPRCRDSLLIRLHPGPLLVPVPGLPNQRLT